MAGLQQGRHSGGIASAYDTCAQEGVVTPALREVPSILSRLHSAHKALDDLLSRLESRLGPVVAPEPPSKGGETGDAVSITSLGGQVHVAVVEAESFCNRVNSLLQRLEL